MGFLDSFKAWFKTEAAEVEDLGRKTRSRLDADLDRREAALNATPEQRLEQLQQQIAEGDATFEGLQSKIDGRQALAGATADVAGLGQDKDTESDVMDLESEEVIPPEPRPDDQPS